MIIKHHDTILTAQILSQVHKACLPTLPTSPALQHGSFPPLLTHLGRKGLHHPSMMDHPGRFARFCQPPNSVDRISRFRRFGETMGICDVDPNLSTNSYTNSSTTKENLRQIVRNIIIPKPELFEYILGGHFPDTSRTPINWCFSQPEKGICARSSTRESLIWRQEFHSSHFWPQKDVRIKFDSPPKFSWVP